MRRRECIAANIVDLAMLTGYIGLIDMPFRNPMVGKK